jgi:sugar phosphate isomerase/epimerase
MNLAFASNAFKRNTLEEAIGLIAAVGYRGVELMADTPHALPEAMTALRKRDLHRRLADLGMTVSNVNAFTLFACGDTYHPTWIEHDPAERSRRIEHTRRAVELAAEFGSKTVSLQPGGPMIGMNLSRSEAGKRFADGISACIETARSCDVTLAIEPEPGLFIQTSGEYAEWKQQFFLGEQQVRMNCDIGHLFCVGDDLPSVIRSHHAEIAHVHLEDIGANRVHQHLTPGKGAIDFAAVFAALREVKYTGRLTVELYPYETTAAGVARLAWDHLTPILESSQRVSAPG